MKLLLEDTNRFLEFPWGRLVYERLHESLNGTLKDMVAANSHLKDRPTYALYGFPMAFQVSEVIQNVIIRCQLSKCVVVECQMYICILPMGYQYPTIYIYISYQWDMNILPKG